MTLIKFLVLIRGALTPPPTILTPVVCIPLKLTEEGCQIKDNITQ